MEICLFLGDLEKKVGHIDVSTSRAQEKTYATHVAAMGGDSKWSDSDWLDAGAGSSGSGARGKHYEKNRARKAKQKAAKGGQTKNKEHQVNRSGKVSKKGCYRCSGAHRVDKCPYPFVTPAE
jgi:hypothetical protein